MSSQLITQHPQATSNGSPSTLILPYGYQIDLDFIRYCENLNNVDPSDAELQRRHRRRQRQSMEVMLGIQLEMQQQINQMSEIWDKKPPDPPPRSHMHNIESPIVPRLNKHVTKWDPDMNEVVSDFERTLERSKKKIEKVEDVKKDTCISPPRKLPQPNQQTRSQSEKPSSHHHISIESIDGSSSMQISPPERRSSLDKKRIHDLEEQIKLIPLLQLQIQSLKDERKQLLAQIENSRAPSTTSSSSNTQAQFQVQRVSPVSLQSMKLPQNSIPKRTVGTNTNFILRRDVGTVSEKPSFVNSSTMTDFKLPCDGNDRLYSEKDLKKTVELVHSKMRKTMTSVATQHDEIKDTRNVGTEIVVSNKSVGCGTDEVKLMVASTGNISIDPSEREESQGSSLSLKDLSKLPNTRNSGTQTAQGSVHHQQTQASPQSLTKCTDSLDLIRTIHRSTGTEIIQKRDQNVHTADLIKVHNNFTNTIPPPVIQKRTTACNTTEVNVKSIGVNCEEVHLPLSTSGSASKIPRPSPSVQRKFARQDTFTVTTQPQEVKEVSPPPSVASILSKLKESSPVRSHHVNISSIFGNSREASPIANPSSLFDVRRTPERERTPVSECPVEKAIQLTMNHHRSPSPPPIASKSPEVPSIVNEVVEAVPEDPVEPSKMPMSPSIEYLDDDDEDDEEFEDDEFNDEQLPSNMPMRPPPTSISTIRLVQEGRVRIKPSKEMIAALKVLNDHLEKYSEPIESQIKSAREIASNEWFQISSTEKANPDNVEDYLDYFEEQSWDLLTYIVNMVDKNGNTAMHYAVSHGNFDVVSILLDAKVSDVNQTNNAGYTCIMLVSLAKLVMPEHRSVVQRLFKLADVNIRASKNSQTALMLAVSHGNFTMVQMLVESGADINIQDDDGSTALMCAAEQGHLDIIKYLLGQPDCDSTKQDVDGNTALKISLEAGYHDIGCLLYAHEHLLRSKSGVKRTSSRKSSTSSLT